MKGLIDFIEKYLNREQEFSRNVFKVSVESVSKGQGFWIHDPSMFLPRSFDTITLDEDDLKYLFDKYFPLYDGAKEAKKREEEKCKQKEIQRLQEKIDKLKNNEK